MHYISYFFYLAWHWNLRLAWFVIRYEIWGENRYGISTTGTSDLSDALQSDDLQYATWYEPVNYYSAEWLFNHVLRAEVRDGFLDVGCGKGRTLAIAASHGFRRIDGIDFSPSLCQAAEKTREKINSTFSGLDVAVHCTNIRDYDIPDYTGVIFLFNPFDAPIMEILVDKVKESLARRRRPLKILYANPQCKKLWLDAGFKETDGFAKLRYLQGVVLQMYA